MMIDGKGCAVILAVAAAIAVFVFGIFKLIQLAF
jgi:hypothetical protein